jgi:hypothetical protein
MSNRRDLTWRFLQRRAEFSRRFDWLWTTRAPRYPVAGQMKHGAPLERPL